MKNLLVRTLLALASLAPFAVTAGVPQDPAQVKPLAVGTTIPTVTVRGPDGTDRTLGPRSLAQPTILIFYRGGWCPYCNTHLGELRTAESALIDLEAASGETHHELPVPAVFIVDRSGVIRFVYANADYKVRLAPDVLVTEASRVVQ